MERHIPCLYLNNLGLALNVYSLQREKVREKETRVRREGGRGRDREMQTIKGRPGAQPVALREHEVSHSFFVSFNVAVKRQTWSAFCVQEEHQEAALMQIV